MKRLLFLGALIAAAPCSAQAWSAGTIKGEGLGQAEMGRITCGLLEKYGPSKSYHDLSIVIPKSPYGRLTATMGSQRWLELGVSMKRYPKRPPPKVRAEIRRWLISHLPAKPKPCTFLLASPAWLGRVGYPDVPAMVPEEEYVTIQLDLAHKAVTLEPDAVWRWSDGALAAFRALDRKKKRKYQRDPRLRAAAYAVVEQPAPDGLSKIGKRGYCMLYDNVRTLFRPKSSRERRSLKQARRKLGCR